MVARWTRVFWSDLSGYVVRTPGAADAPKEKARQKASREEQAKTGELLPDTPISLPRIRAADLDVQYKVAKIESDKMPVDSLDAHLLMEDGFISVKPLKLGVGNGSVVADIALDGRKSPIHTIADLDFRELDFSRSEERRVGKECVSTCRSRWSPDH